MKRSGLLLLALVLGAIVSAGCSQPGLPSITPPSPSPTTATTTAPPPTFRPTFTLGDIYLSEPYGYIFRNESSTLERSFLVDNPSWGISLKVVPQNNASVNTSWFTVDVLNTNNLMTESFGYGGNYSYEPEQMIPMYNQGPYKITMKGSQVKVWIVVAKRNPL